ncbi:MAG: GNAT family N-acetyltransferase [Desulfobacteraceae bacterium]|jgi:GNAT superfamily N-acetyltransferase
MNYRQMQPGEETRAIELVSGVFHEFVAPLYSDEGVKEFMKFADAETLAERLEGDDFVLIAESLDEIIGVIEISAYRHIALFFVAPEHQRRGIGRELLRKALDECLAYNPNLNEITVNSSPNAVSAYRALGFIERDKEKTINGIRFVPMALKIH